MIIIIRNKTSCSKSITITSDCFEHHREREKRKVFASTRASLIIDYHEITS